jgi:hypothetical protein
MQAATRQETLEGTPANFLVESVCLLFQRQYSFSFRLDPIDLYVCHKLSPFIDVTRGRW